MVGWTDELIQSVTCAQAWEPCRAALGREWPPASHSRLVTSDQRKNAPRCLGPAGGRRSWAPAATRSSRRPTCCSPSALRWPLGVLQSVPGCLDLSLGGGAGRPRTRPRRSCPAPAPCRSGRNARSPAGRIRAGDGGRAGAPGAGRPRARSEDLVVAALLVGHPEHADRRLRIRQPGNVGSSTSTSASSGSPSSPSVSGTKP